jgi:FkbM family methyltransferase
VPLKVGELVVGDEADLLAISEVLAGDEYAVDGLQPATIVDVGSHIGASIVFFRQRYPEAEIIGIEPDPRSFVKLRVNTAGISRVELHNCAIADHSGDALFYLPNQSWASSLVPMHGGQPHTRVCVRTLDDIIGDRTVGLLKVDIEGAEYAALRAFRGLSLVRAIAIEYHAETCSASLAQLLDLLHGFAVVRVRGDSASQVVVIAVRRDTSAAG